LRTKYNAKKTGVNDWFISLQSLNTRDYLIYLRSHYTQIIKTKLDVLIRYKRIFL
jgi:hypothetical protein